MSDTSLSGALPSDQDKVALDLQRRHFATLLDGDMAAFGALFNDDALWEWPFVIPGNKRQVKGREQIDAYLAPLPERLRFTSFNNMRLLTLANGEGHVVTYDLTGEFLPSRAPVCESVRRHLHRPPWPVPDLCRILQLVRALYKATSSLGKSAPFAEQR